MAHRSSPARLGHSRFSPTSPISSPSKESAEIARQIAALKAKYARTREAESRKASLNTNEAPSSVILSKNAIENDLASTKSDIAAIEARIQKTRDRHDDIRQKWNRIPPELQRSAMDEIDELTSLHSILSASLKRLKVDEERLGQSLKSVQKTMAKKAAPSVLVDDTFETMLDKYSGIDIPRPVHDAMAWKHIRLYPILYYTSEFGRSASAANLHFSNGVLMSTSDAKDRDWNTRLDRSSYQEGLAQWIFMLARHPKEEIRTTSHTWWNIFRTHVMTIAPSHKGWPAERAYIEALRTTSIPIGSRTPTWDDDGMWRRATESVKESERVELMKEVTDKLRNEFTDMISGMKRNTSTATTSTNTQSSRTRQPSAITSSSSSQPPQAAASPFTHLWCCICGSTAHFGKDCRETTQVNKKPVIAYRVPGGGWRLPSDKKFCYGFNGGSARICTDANCKYGEHLCSRCGSSSHGATDCP